MTATTMPPGVSPTAIHQTACRDDIRRNDSTAFKQAPTREEDSNNSNANVPNHLQPNGEPLTEDHLTKRIDRLGRERPSALSSLPNEIAFVFSVSMSQFMTEFFVSGFTVILPTLIHELSIPQAAAVWPATAFSLAIAGTLLAFGRLGDMDGPYPFFLGGLVWLLGWSVIAGLSTNALMLDCCRALQGLGAAAFLPSGVALMGSIYRPGPRKNLVFAIYGTAAVFGFFGGILIAGIVGEFVRWGFYFWIGAMLTAITLVTSIFSVPVSLRRAGRDKAIQLDIWGVATIVPRLILVVFAITQSAHAPSGWRTPYIPALFVLGALLLLSAIYIETHLATQPLLPASLFQIPSMTPLILAVFLLYGTWGIFSVYGTLYFQNIMGASPLQIVAWYTPLGVAGLLFSVLEGFILHRVPGKVLLVISGLGALWSQLLIAFIPLEGASYWAWVFPATIGSTIGIDVSTILMTVFVTTMVPISQQGLAGGVVNSVLQLGVAFVLGLTDILQAATVQEVGLAKSYKNTFWFGVGAAAAALIIMAVWAEVPKATSELSAEEKEELLREAASEVQGQEIERRGSAERDVDGSVDR